MYSVRERVTAPFLIHRVSSSILDGVGKHDSRSSMVSASDLMDFQWTRSSKDLADAWTRNDAVGKVECGYPFIYGPCLEYVRSVHNPWVLEIGIFRGGSHRAWRDLLPEGRIRGIDIDEATLFEEERIQTTSGDQIRVESLSAAVEALRGRAGWDLVVDDGWHQPEAGLKSMQVLLPQLRVGGFYVLEDINAMSYGRLWRSFLTRLPANFSSVVVTQDNVEELGKYGYEVIVIRRMS